MLFGKRKRIVKHILVVEDEPLTAFDNEQLIASAGYEVVATCDNVAEALATLDSGQVDLILSDVKLNGDQDGVDLAREARRRGISVLLVTGRCPDDAASYAVGCLMKPYNDRTLRDAIHAVEDHLAGNKPKLVKGLELFPLASS